MLYQVDIRAIEISTSDIKRVFKKYPDLNSFGFGTLDCIGKLAYSSKIKQEQKYIIKNIHEVRLTASILAYVDKIQTINTKRSSYGLKHWIERLFNTPDAKEYTYISNGSFIVAAILMGFDIKTSYYMDRSPNAFFNISNKSVKEITKMFQQNESLCLP